MTATAFALPNPVVIAPKSLLDKAGARPAVRVAIAGAGAELPMIAAKDAVASGLMTPVFIGSPTDITAQAARLDWDISGFDIIPADGESDAAAEAVRACHDGLADVLMKGHLHTDVFMKAVLNREHGLRTEARLVHIFHMTAPESDRALLLCDAALNVAPDMATRQAGIIACVDLARVLGVARPRVALLSATESVIPSVVSSGECAQLADWAVDAVEADVAGPLALDLILSAEAARIKGVDCEVCGAADAVIVPDIVSGNALFKALVYTRAACAAGIVLGARVPILLTSRADPAAARLASVALASLVISD